MGLDRLTQSAIAVAEEDSSGIENIQSTKPPLRLVQGDLANKPDAGLEKRKAQRFRVKGVDRVRGLTVIRGDVDGQPRAIVTHTPLELLLPAEPGPPDTAFQAIRSGTWGKVAAGLALVGASIAAMAGCTPNIKPKIASNHAALSTADVDNLDEPIAAAWTEPGDNRPQISEMEGNVMFTFARGGDIYYVDCAELEDCLASGEPETMTGLPEGGFSYATAAIYQTLEGNSKIIFQIATEIYEMDIDNVGGVLTVSGDPIEIGAGGFSYMKVGGVPHMLRHGGGEVYLHNLHIGEDTLLELDDGPMAICGAPHQDDGGVAIGSFLYNPGAGPSYCRLHSAPTLEGLATVLADDFIASQNDAPGAGPGTNLKHPRSRGNILVYVREDADGTRIYHAIAPIAPPADAGPGPDPDAGTDGPGTGTDGPTPDPDAGEGEAEGEDAGTDGPPTPEDGPQTPREDGGPKPKDDGGDKPKPPDFGEGEAEGENPLTCDLGAGGAKVTVVEQNCTFSDCDNDNNDGDVRINGSCTVEIDLGEFGNGTPVTLTVDGEYTVNVLEQVAGQLISGLFQADTGGNDFRSAYGAFVLAPEGTTYSGEGRTRMPSTNPADINMSEHPQFRVSVAEGRVTVFFNGEEVMTLNAGDEHTFPQGGPNEIDDNPKPGCQCASPGSSDNNNPLNSSIGLSLFALAAALKLRPGRQRKRK